MRAVIETIAGLPPGSLGFRVHGTVTAADYRDVVLPPLRATVTAGQRLRVLVAVGPDFHEQPAAGWEGFKADLELGVGHRQAWERVAIVSDIDWVRRASAFFAWMMPGEVRTYREDQLDAAKSWFAEP